MAWTYSGNPLTNENDRYRFLIGDTISYEPILQDEEIAFVLSEYTSRDVRLLKLFEAICLFFMRDTEVSLGPLLERPQSRYEKAKENLDFYRKKVNSAGISVPTYGAAKVFGKGMQSND